jgi:hypothetical protein
VGNFEKAKTSLCAEARYGSQHATFMDNYRKYFPTLDEGVSIIYRLQC